MLPAAMGLVVGIAADNTFGPNVAFQYGLLVAAAAMLLVKPLRPRSAWVIAFIAAAGLGALKHDSTFRRVAENDISVYAPNEPTLVRLTGVLLTRPSAVVPREHFFSRWTYRGERTRFTLRASEIIADAGRIPVTGTVLVTVYGDIDLTPGSTLKLLGNLSRPSPPDNAGQFDYRLWLARHGVRAQLFCRNPDLITVVQPPSASPVAWIDRLRQSARSAIRDDTVQATDPNGGLLETMVLGQRHAISRDIEELFIRAGIAHYLAVSGFHVGIVAAAAWFVGRIFGGTRRQSAWLVIAVIVLYTCIVDPRPSALRASIIGIVLCVGLLLRRRANTANSLALAMMILLIYRPTTLFEPGFQMSFAAVFAIFYLHAPLARLIRRLIERRPLQDDSLFDPPRVRYVGWKYYRHWLCRWLIPFVAVSVSSCLASTAIVPLHFHYLAPMGVVFSVILFPFVAATLLIGLAHVIVAALLPAFAPVCGFLSDGAASILLTLVKMANQMSPILEGRWLWIGHLFFLALTLALIALVRVGDRTIASHLKRSIRNWTRSLIGPPDAPRPRRIAVVATIPVLLLTSLLLARTATGERPLRLTVLSVGLGSATVIEFPNGQVWIYDCGTNGGYDVGQATIVPFLRWRRINRIDRIFVSHANLDHYGGIFAIMDALPCGPLYLNNLFARDAASDGPAAAMLNEMKRRNHPLRRITADHTTIDAGHSTVSMLWPPLGPADLRLSANDSSTVLRLTYKGRSILLTGDIETAGMAGLLDQADESPAFSIRADVLLMPHHGGVESNTSAFVDAVSPHVCVQSSNRRSPDDPGSHRDSDLEFGSLQARLVAAVADRPLVNTADRGAIRIEFDSSGLYVSTYDPQRAGFVRDSQTLKPDNSLGR